MPETKEPDLLAQILNALPELANLAKEALEAAGAHIGGAPDPVKRQEAREALLAADDFVDKLRGLSEFEDQLGDPVVERLVDELLDQAYSQAKP